MSTKDIETTSSKLSRDQLVIIAKNFELLNARLERYDKTLTLILTTVSVMSIIFLAGAGLSSLLQ
jgi:hypothetical protein